MTHKGRRLKKEPEWMGVLQRLTGKVLKDIEFDDNTLFLTFADGDHELTLDIGSSLLEQQVEVSLRRDPNDWAERPFSSDDTEELTTVQLWPYEDSEVAAALLYFKDAAETCTQEVQSSREQFRNVADAFQELATAMDARLRKFEARWKESQERRSPAQHVT